MSTALHFFGYTALIFATITGFFAAGSCDEGDGASGSAFLMIVTGLITALCAGSWLVLVIFKAATA